MYHYRAHSADSALKSTLSESVGCLEVAVISRIVLRFHLVWYRQMNRPEVPDAIRPENVEAS